MCRELVLDMLNFLHSFHYFPAPVNYVNLIKNKTCLPPVSIIAARIKKDNFLSLSQKKINVRASANKDPLSVS